MTGIQIYVQKLILFNISHDFVINTHSCQSSLYVSKKNNAHFSLTVLTAQVHVSTRIYTVSCLHVSILYQLIAEVWRAKRACGAPWVSKSTHPRKFGNHVTVHRPPAARPSAPQGSQCSIPHFLATVWEHRKTDIARILHINVVIN